MENKDVNLTLGELLAQKRSTLALPIVEISRVISVRPVILSALEENRLNELGAPVYIKSYALRYAEFLGMDRDFILQKLQASLNCQKNIKIIPLEERDSQHKRRGFLWLYSLLLCFVLTILGIYFWPKTSENLPDSNYIASTRTAVSEAVDNEIARKSADAAYFSQQTTSNSSDNIVNVSSLGQLENHANLKISESVLPLSLTDSLQNGSESELKITVQDSCWAEIRDADKKRILYATLQENEVYIVRGKPPFNIKFGNVQSIVSFEINGQAVDTNLYRPSLNTTVSRFKLNEITNSL